MSVPVSRDLLGTVTAYSYAVAGGYTGTEAEFQELLANVAIDLSEIENLSVIVTPLPEGSTPTASYDSGVLTLGIPKGDTGEKGEKGDTGEGAVNVSLLTPVRVIPTGSDGYLTAQFVIAIIVGAFKGSEPYTITSVTANKITVELNDTQIQAIDPVIVLSGTTATVRYTIPAQTKLKNNRQISNITAVVDGETHVCSMDIVSVVKGETGATPDLTIGTVQTLPAGSQATASITGTDEEPVLNLGLPKGDAGNVQDVQINGTSILADGVASIPAASSSVFGVVKVGGGLVIEESGAIRITSANDNMLKAGVENYRPVVPSKQHASVFYGMAKAAGDSTQSASSNAVGNYTENAKSKISDMLNAPVTVTGTTPTITAKSGIQYICGEVATLDITLPDSGIVDVVFTSGSTPTVLTVTPPTGQTVRWANGFDATSLEADTVYEVNFLNGLGAVMTWT